MEIPSITASSYLSSQLDHKLLFGGAPPQNALKQQEAFGEILRRVQQDQPIKQPVVNNQPTTETTMSAARIVKVFIADANENLPLDKRVLYSGDERLTDLTDQELFFDVPIADLLAKHNEVRKATVDKTQAEKFGRDIFLEPARIRDLKMVVVTVAQF